MPDTAAAKNHLAHVRDMIWLGELALKYNLKRVSPDGEPYADFVKKWKDLEALILGKHPELAEESNGKPE